MPSRRRTTQDHLTYFRLVSMNLANGSSSPNEDISRHKPFTQLCLRRLNKFGDALTMPGLHRAPYSTRLTKTTKRCSRRSHSTPPTIVDVPADLSTPFDNLMNSDRAPGPASRPSSCTCTRRLRTARHTHTHMGRTSRAGEGMHSAVNWQEVEHFSRRSCELVSKI
jgi:hypothetical protein